MIALFGSQHGSLNLAIAMLRCQGSGSMGLTVESFRTNSVSVATAIDNEFTKRSRSVLSSTAVAALD